MRTLVQLTFLKRLIREERMELWARLHLTLMWGFFLLSQLLEYLLVLPDCFVVGCFLYCCCDVGFYCCTASGVIVVGFGSLLCCCLLWCWMLLAMLQTKGLHHVSSQVSDYFVSPSVFQSMKPCKTNDCFFTWKFLVFMATSFAYLHHSLQLRAHCSFSN